LRFVPALPRRQHVAIRSRFTMHPEHVHSTTDRSIYHVGVLLDVTNNCRPVREPLGLSSLVRIARQLERPIRKLEVQRVPSLGMPSLGHSRALEHHVLLTFTRK